MGVHKPRIKRNPATRSIAAVIVALSGGSPPNRELARKTSTQPMIKRMRSKPMPGQPLANVE